MMSDWLVSRDGRAATLTINRPQAMNAVTVDMFADLATILDEMGADDRVRVLVIRGSGTKSFVAGADIGEFEEELGTPEKAVIYDGRVEEGMARLVSFKKPTVAMVHGYALGTGVFLAAACDLRIASDKAQFSVPVGRFGIMPSAPDLYRLARLVGFGTALEMCLTARTYVAHEALRIGLVNRIVPSEQLETVTASLVNQMSSLAPLSMQAVKEMLRTFTGRPVCPEIQEAQRWYELTYGSEDVREGVNAFAEKRDPRFSGK